MFARARQIGFAFLLASFATAIAGSIFSTQFVVAALEAVGVQIPVGTRLLMTLTDLRILMTMLPAVIACFVPAFLIAGFLSRRLGGPRMAWFAVAGGSALVVELLIIEAQLGLMPIAGARTSAGIALQGVAGVFGGLVYTWLSKPAIAEAKS